MGLIDQIFAGLAGGAHSYEHQQDTAAKEAIAAQLHAAQMANIQSEIQNRQEQRYAQGIRQGQAPDAKGVLNALNLGAGVADAGGVPGVNVASQLGNVQTQQDKPEQYAPDRYSQVSPSAYVDNTATPEAVQGRRQQNAATIAMQQAAANADRTDARSAILQDRLDARSAARSAAMRDKPDRTQLVQSGTDANGKPIWAEYNKDSHQLTALPSEVSPKGSAQTVQGQAQQARLLAAVSEARLAMPRMRAYEDKLLSGEQSIGPVKQAAGTLMTNLSGAHGVLGALTQAGSEAGVNMTDPEYAQYLRDAATIGRAEQMMSPRGGNETMVRANSLLARAGTGAMKNTIDAARMAREALFGQSGGIEQTLTPQQSEKLNTSVGRIHAGQHAGSAEQPSSGHTQQLQQLYDAAVAKHGAARVLQELGPRPE